jgi:hypothetical protein
VTITNAATLSTETTPAANTSSIPSAENEIEAFQKLGIEHFKERFQTPNALLHGSANGEVGAATDQNSLNDPLMTIDKLEVVLREAQKQLKIQHEEFDAKMKR